jgi:Raf kinase inhibitor-like YbhB/YbcL family protein
MTKSAIGRRDFVGLAAAGVAAAALAPPAAAQERPPQPYVQIPTQPAAKEAATAVPATPYDRLPPVPPFTVTSSDVRDGAALPKAQWSGVLGVPGGLDASPQLSWSGFPEPTKSFVVTMFDPDAPTPSGFWHWAVVDVPASVPGLPAGAGADNSNRLPTAAFQLPNDASMARYLGAAPPAGSGRHRYYIVVHAVDVESLGVDKGATPAFLSFNLVSHTLARAIMVPYAEA